MVRIMLIGAGRGGMQFAKSLAHELSATDGVEVVVLEKSAFFFHTYGTPRAFVDESYAPKLFIPFDNAIPERARAFVRIVRGVVTKLSSSPQQVSYRAIGDDDQEASEETVLTYDHLVLATGSSYTAPLKPSARSRSRFDVENQLAHVRAEVAQAARVLIVGAGSVGCEVAGEIASKYPDKHITLLSAAAELLPNNNVSTEFRDRLLDGLTTKLNVKVILGERLVSASRLTSHSFTTRTLETDKGRRIESDVQLLCAGFLPASALAHAMDASLVDDRGFIRVNPQLQLARAASVSDTRTHYDNIFALGDVCDNPSPKEGYIAGDQGRFLARELLAVIREQQVGFATPFPNVELERMSIPLGPEFGFSQLADGAGVVDGSAKCDDYIAKKTWGRLGAELP